MREESLDARIREYPAEDQKEIREELPEKRLDERDGLWDRFSGKRIVVAGAGGEEQEKMLRNLAAIGSRREKSFAVKSGFEKVGPGDYVLLFAHRGTASGKGKVSAPENPGRGNMEGKSAHDRGDEAGRPPKSWEQCSGTWEQTKASWDGMLSLAEELEAMRQAEPEAVLLVTGSAVYGKSFGKAHPLREEELGYVCHASRQDGTAQCMRMAEHLACRLAREGLPVKVARMDKLPSGEGLDEFLDTVMTVLLDGGVGEVYNIPAPEEARDGFHSPLRPMAIRMEGGKAERLKRI